jgi:protocatechuate 3,4-dioxygenase beta subunit
MDHALKFSRTIVLLMAAGCVLLGQTSGVSVEGLVTEQGTNTVLSKATLDLRSLDNPNARYPAISTGEGKFSFRNVLPGRYSLLATRSGYVRAEYGQRGPNSAAATLEVRAGQNVRDIRISMIPSAAISGRVIDTNGEPAINAQMHAWRVSYAEGWRKLVAITSQVTNDLGEYRLFGLPPGQYYVSAQPDPPGFIRSPAYASQTPPVPGVVVLAFTAGGSGGLADPANRTAMQTLTEYAPIYFGGAASEFSATPITVSPGNDLRGVDIPVDRIPMVSLRGTVIDSVTGEPVRAMVTVTPLAPNVAFTSLTTITVTGGVLSVVPVRAISASPQGQFQTAALLHGSYLVTAVADSPGRRLVGQTIASTRSLDPAGMRIMLAPALEVSGRIAFEGAAVPNLKVGLISTASQPLDAPPVAVAADGSFTLQGVVPGRYLLQVSPLSNAYVKSAHFANGDILNGGIVLERAPDSRIEIVVAGDSGRMNGTVSGADRQPLAGITTVLVPDDRNRIDLFQSVVTDASGQYRFSGVAPGRYKLFAWEDVEKNAWRDSGFMTLHEDGGIPVAVDAAGNHTAAITAIPPR